MAIYRGPGGSGDAVNDSSSETRLAVEARDAALAAQAAAEAAQAAAETAETNAETAETNAETAETNAETAATNAASSASAASTSASNASSSASSASTSATNAASSASSASSSASAASTSATNAATSATNAANSATAAATSATNASNSATAAASSASSASSSASTATTQASNASTSATNAASSATSAASSASTATTQAGLASTSATNAANSASAASTSATNASNSASAASTSASNAATSATAAQTAETNAETAQAAAEAARDAALSAYDNFDDRYLGPKASDPTLDNDGNALVSGALYFNTTTNVMKVYTGSSWVAAYVSAAGVLLAANNLSDLNSVSTARTNLGVAIGTDVQAYDANTAKLNAAQSWSAAQSFNAGVTLGDASGDALTINSSAVSIPNGLNFDSNTFVIDATNNRVGVGLTSPTQAIDVQGSVAIRDNYLRILNSGTVTTFVGLGSALGGTANDTAIRNDTGNILFGFSGSEKMRLDSSGNLGLGVTPSAWNAGGKIIEIGNAGNILFGNTNDVILSANAYYSTGWKYGGNNYASYYEQNSGAHKWFTAPAGTAGTAITFTQAMTLDSSGNLGIGTTSPAAKLDIAGSARVNNSGGSTILSIGDTAASTYSNIRMFGGSGKYNYQISVQNNVNNSFEITPSTAAGGVTFSTPALVINSSGNVGIGTASPSNKLVVNGSSGTTQIQLTDSTASNNLILGVNTTTVDINAVNGFPMVLYTSNAERMRITNAGNVGIGTNSPGAKLDVNGSLRAGGLTVNSSSILSGANQLTLDYNSSTTANRIVSWGANTSTRGALVFASASSDASLYNEYMRLDASGNLGLGVTPSAWGSPFKPMQLGQGGFISGRSDTYTQVHVGANSYFNGTDWVYTSSAAASRHWQSAGVHYFDRAASGTAGNAITWTTGMTLDASGRLIIGSTSSYGGRATLIPGTNPTTGSDANAQIAIGESSANSAYKLNVSYINIGGGYSGSLQSLAGGVGSNLLLNPDGGNVGIGTSSPSYKLDVAGSAGIGIRYKSSGSYGAFLADNTSSTGGGYFTAYQNGSQKALFGVSGAYEGTTSSDAMVAADATGGAIRFYTNGSPSEKMRLDSSGNLGIGTIAPGAKLDVQTAYDRGFWIEGSASSTVYARATQGGTSTNLRYLGLKGEVLVFETGASTGTTTTEKARISTAGGFSVGTTADPGAGAIYATGSITANYSDERLKTKVGSIENALDKVCQIETMIYHANEKAVELGYDASKIEVGVTAQSVQYVQPEAVVPAPVDQQYLTVHYDRLVPLLIEAIKELKDEISILKEGNK